MILLLVVPLAFGALAMVFLGFLGVSRGSMSPQRSNRFMRWRVILQACAILLLCLLAALMR
jgi:hypothetical protein